MTYDTMVAIMISFVSLIFGIYSGVSNVRRSNRAEHRRDISELTMVIVKLEDIGTGVSEIKSDMNSVRDDIKELTGRLMVAEQQIRQINKRVDEIKIQKKQEEK